MTLQEALRLAETLLNIGIDRDQAKALRMVLDHVSGEDIETDGSSLDNWLREWFCGDHASLQAMRKLKPNPDGSLCKICRAEELEKISLALRTDSCT